MTQLFLLSISIVSSLVHGHFVLQVPTSLGFYDAMEGTGPCGSFDIKSRSPSVTDWPIAGGPIQIITTHTQAQWEIKAALLNDTSTFKYMVPIMTQQGLGTFCLPDVPGIAEWVDQDAVIQMIQHAVDGALYQCAAIRFVNGAAAAVPGSCKNSTSVTAKFDALTSTAAMTSPTPAATGLTNSTAVTTTKAASTTPTNGVGQGARIDPATGFVVAGAFIFEWLL